MNPLFTYGPDPNGGSGRQRQTRAGRPQHAALYPLIFSVADAETGAGLPDAVFKITGAGGFAATANAGYGGVVAFAPLQPGEYRLKQTAAPPGYVPDAQEYTVIVNRYGVANVEGRPARMFRIRLARAVGALRFETRHAESGRPLAGAVFDLMCGDTVVQNAVSGNDGQVLFEGLRPGDYRLVETAPPPGFRAMPGCVRVSVAADGTAAMGETGDLQTILNSPCKFSFRFSVADADSGLPAARVRFALLGEDGTALGTAVSDDSGAVALTAAAGRFILRETARDGADAVEAKSYAVQIDPEGRAYIDGLPALRFTARSRTRAAVFVYKISDDGTALCGAQFSLIQDGACVLTAETGETGVAVLTRRLQAAYSLLETRPPAGYIPDLSMHDVIVGADGAVTIDGAHGNTLTVRNTALPFQLYFVKVDPVTGFGLQGAEYELLADGRPVAAAASGRAGGVYFGKLPPGAYVLRETAPPSGYLPDVTAYPVSVSAAGEVTIAGAPAENFYMLRPSAFQLYVCLYTADAGALSGAVYELRQQGARAYAESTDSSGYAVFRKIAPGRYALMQTKALAGFAPDTTPRSVHVDADGGVEIDGARTPLLQSEALPLSSTDSDGAECGETVRADVIYRCGDQELARSAMAVPAGGDLTVTAAPFAGYRLVSADREVYRNITRAFAHVFEYEPV